MDGSQGATEAHVTFAEWGGQPWDVYKPMFFLLVFGGKNKTEIIKTKPDKVEIQNVIQMPSQYRNVKQNIKPTSSLR